MVPFWKYTSKTPQKVYFSYTQAPFVLDFVEEVLVRAFHLLDLHGTVRRVALPQCFTISCFVAEFIGPQKKCTVSVLEKIIVSPEV